MTQVTIKNDHEIHAAVLQELKWDPQVDETEIGVELDAGVVTLTGTVDSLAKKIAAQEAAHRVKGVLDVANDIQVRAAGAPGHTDTEIAHAVRQVLEWDVLVPHERIQVTVTEGQVTLEGSVPFLADQHNVERIVRGLAGVREVTNKLVVNAPRIAPADVHHSIEQALRRRADYEAGQISVIVKDGTAILLGRVSSWNEKQAVLRAAGWTLGVRKVEDRLIIDPYV